MLLIEREKQRYPVILSLATIAGIGDIDILISVK